MIEPVRPRVRRCILKLSEWQQKKTKETKANNDRTNLSSLRVLLFEETSKSVVNGLAVVDDRSELELTLRSYD